MDQRPRRNPARRLLVPWVARFGLLFASLGAGLLLVVLLDPLLPGTDFVAEMPSETFHHERVPGGWVAEDYEWGPHPVYIDAAGWRAAPPAAVDEASRSAHSSGDSLRGSEMNAAKRFRMAVMGDSFVEAIHVPWEQTFVARLQARAGGRGEVVNRAIASYSPLLALLRWRRQVVHERPTHLLLLLCFNDVANDQHYTAQALRREGGGDETRSSGEVDDVTELAWEWPDSRPWRLDKNRWSRLKRRWRARVRALDAAWRQSRLRDPDRPTRLWREYNPALTPLTDRYLRELATRAKEAGVEFTLSAVPNSWEFRDPALRGPELRVGATFPENVAAWAEASGVRYVDLQAPVRAAAAEGRRVFFERDGHFTPAGHAVAAEVFAAAWPELFAVGDKPRR